MVPHNEEPRPDTMPYKLVRRLVTLSLVFGIIGGLGGGYLLVRYLPDTIPLSKQSLIVQESSAAVNVAKNVSPSVVSIVSETASIGFLGRAQSQQGAGTGMIVSTDGLILTNNHVVDGVDTLSVFTSDGKEYKNAKVVARDTQNDIAFLRINASGLKAVKLGDSSAVSVGTRVIAIGNALGQFQNTVTEGIISGLGRPVRAGTEQGGDVEQLQNLFQTDAAINPGNSGGPLVDLSGHVIGINTAVAGNAQSIGFAIPINLAKKELQSVKVSGTIKRPYLGVRYIPITKDFATQKGISVADGAYITGDQQGLAVIAGSPADKAGLKEGDIISKFGGTTVDQNHSLSTLINNQNVRDKVIVTYIRDGKTSTVTVTLESAPKQ